MRVRFTLALTPALSPGERGNRPPVSGEFARALVRVGLRCENQKTGAAKLTVERARRAACALPLLGERAGVRASVQTPEPRENIERPTSNTERRSERGFALPFDVRRWMFDVRCSSGFMGSIGPIPILPRGPLSALLAVGQMLVCTVMRVPTLPPILSLVPL